MSDRAHGPRFNERICPECGEPTQVIHEGYCPDCCEYRQAMLDFHNYQYDRWDKMTDAERDAEIGRAAQ